MRMRTIDEEEEKEKEESNVYIYNTRSHCLFNSELQTDLSWASLQTWLCSARKETGESMASRDLAHNRTTFSPVL